VILNMLLNTFFDRLGGVGNCPVVNFQYWSLYGLEMETDDGLIMSCFVVLLSLQSGV
jgi:hypothetical protein